jgi:hypothetical protein
MTGSKSGRGGGGGGRGSAASGESGGTGGFWSCGKASEVVKRAAAVAATVRNLIAFIFIRECRIDFQR